MEIYWGISFLVRICMFVLVNCDILDIDFVFFFKYFEFLDEMSNFVVIWLFLLGIRFMI